VFAQALVSSEDADSFEWAFTQFKAMLMEVGVESPQVWFTDADHAARKAADAVFPAARKYRQVALLIDKCA
jgi:hypothetical protein